MEGVKNSSARFACRICPPLSKPWRRPCVAPLVSVITTLLYCNYFPSLSVVSRVFSALCVYLMFGHHPHPLGYLCAKFRFFCGFHCWASCLLTQSYTHPAYLMSREPKRLRFGISLIQDGLEIDITGNHNKCNRTNDSDCRLQVTTCRLYTS